MFRRSVILSISLVKNMVKLVVSKLINSSYQCYFFFKVVSLTKKNHSRKWVMSALISFMLVNLSYPILSHASVVNKNLLNVTFS